MEINMNDENLMNIVDEVFEEMEVDDIIEKMDDESDEDQPLSIVTMTIVIVMRTLRKLVKKL